MTGIVIPMIMIGALIGRFYGLVITDIFGVRAGGAAAWIDPGVFAVLGSAGFFSGVSCRVGVGLHTYLTS